LRYLFYKAEGLPAAPPPPLDEGMRMELWRPTLLRPVRWDLLALPFLAWSLFHFLGLFANRQFCILLIYKGTSLVHRTCVCPAHFRFPFMAARDLQAAGIWTHPSLRGRGLGLLAILEVMRHLKAPDRPLWFLVREENRGSIRLAEKAGFALVGRGSRTKRLGLRALGCFRLEERLPSGHEGPGVLDEAAFSGRGDQRPSSLIVQ
jgi:GNAT superfamily N-acetyltransferase